MKTLIDEEVFDYSLETSDWRYNASIVGLVKYFDFLISTGKAEKEELYEIDKENEDIIKYNSKKINESDYLLFVEEFFKDFMHHKVIESILLCDELSKEQIDLINEKLKANAIMKSTFGKITYSEENKEKILKLINENRSNIIKETYKRGKSLYSNFINENLLFSEKNKICRVINYYIDVPKKGKSLGYNWDFSTYEFRDDKIFDFIPFAFSRSYEAFFINNNCSIENLKKSNSLILNSDNPRSTLFNELKNSSDYIDFDVEVIVKIRDKDYYETLYIRKKAISIFKKISNYKGIQFVFRDDEKNPKYMERYIVDAILNGIRLDSIIDMLLKSKNNYSYNIRTLIEVNTLIYGGDNMNGQMKSAYKSAKTVVEMLEQNKVNSYRQKLISAITFKDYDRFCEILLQLSAYSGVTFNFSYDLFEDFEKNKNIAYTFVNALDTKNKEGGDKNEK